MPLFEAKWQERGETYILFAVSFKIEKHHVKCE